MRSLLGEGELSREEKNLAILLGEPLPIYVTHPNNTEDLEILGRVREEVLKTYSKSERREITQFASIHPSGASLLAASKTLAEFKDRVFMIYSEVRGGEISFEGKVPPNNTGEINWSTKREFSWGKDEEKLDEGFPKMVVSTTYPEGSLLISSLYVSR